MVKWWVLMLPRRWLLCCPPHDSNRSSSKRVPSRDTLDPCYSLTNCLHHLQHRPFIFCVAQNWIKWRTWMAISTGLYPLCTQTGRFLFEFYICHPSDWHYNAINQRNWFQYHNLLDIQSLQPVLETNLIQPLDSSASYATRHKLVPFCKWLNISHLDIFIHRPFEFASIWGRKSRDRPAQEDWDQLKRHSTMFGNQIPTFNVPSYSIHVNCGAHEVVLLKASCNDLMSASLGATESPSDKIYLWQKVTGPTPFLFLQKNEFKKVSFGKEPTSISGHSLVVCSIVLGIV